MRFLSHILLLVCLTGSVFPQVNPFTGEGSSKSRSSKNVNPFGGSRGSFQSDVTQAKTVELDFDLALVGKIGRQETRESFQKIWLKFVETHGLDDDGNITSGGGYRISPSDAYAQSTFLHYVKESHTVVSLVGEEVCPSCNHGLKAGFKDGAVADVPCDKCGGEWRIIVTRNYSLGYSGTPPPKVPWVRKKPKEADPKDDPALSANSKELNEAAEKHLSELLASEVIGKSPKGFGVSSVGFSTAPDGFWQLDLGFMNESPVKIDNARVNITFCDPQVGSSNLPKFVTAKAVVNLAPRAKCSVGWTSFVFPGLDTSSKIKGRDDAIASYAFTLKELKRASIVSIEISGISPANAAKAIDIEPKSVWEIKRGSRSSAQGQDARKPPSGRQSYGSGMVFTKDGHIFTNHHVISGSTQIFVISVQNGQIIQKLPATIVSKDPKSDLVILQCKEWKPPQGSPDAPPPVVSSSQCRLGSQVFVLGFPLPGTVSSGVKYTKGDVSALAGLDDDISKIQHTAQIQPGNSGGPMALMDGRVVGVIVSSINDMYALKISGTLPQGINFSIKSDYLRTLASIAGIQIPDYNVSPDPVEHVKAYTVQLVCEK